MSIHVGQGLHEFWTSQCSESLLKGYFGINILHTGLGGGGVPQGLNKNFGGQIFS